MEQRTLHERRLAVLRRQLFKLLQHRRRLPQSRAAHPEQQQQMRSLTHRLQAQSCLNHFWQFRQRIDEPGNRLPKFGVIQTVRQNCQHQVEHVLRGQVGGIVPLRHVVDCVSSRNDLVTINCRHIHGRLPSVTSG